MRHLEWPLAVRMHEGEDNQFQSVAIRGLSVALSRRAHDGQDEREPAEERKLHREEGHLPTVRKKRPIRRDRPLHGPDETHALRSLQPVFRLDAADGADDADVAAAAARLWEKHLERRGEQENRRQHLEGHRWVTIPTQKPAAQLGAVVSTCMQGRSSVAINVPAAQLGPQCECEEADGLNETEQ